MIPAVPCARIQTSYNVTMCFAHNPPLRRQCLYHKQANKHYVGAQETGMQSDKSFSVQISGGQSREDSYEGLFFFSSKSIATL